MHAPTHPISSGPVFHVVFRLARRKARLRRTTNAFPLIGAGNVTGVVAPRQRGTSAIHTE